MGAIVDSALDSVVTIDADGRVVEFNRAAERTFGYVREEVLGRQMCELIIPPGLREAHRRGLAHAVGTSGSRMLDQRLELAGMRADGSEFPVELTITRLDHGGAPLFTGWLRDVTERTRSEEERERLIEREHEVRAAVQRLAQRAALLGEASVRVSASLDRDKTLEAVARAAIPHFADWCTVDIVHDDGSIRPAAVAHADPATEQWAWALRSRYPAAADAPRGAPQVIRTGRPVLVPEILDAELEAAAQDEEHLTILRGLGMRSAIVVPLRAQGQTFGALSLVSGKPGRRYDEHDLATAEELGNRCALAIDNARLYAGARESEERFRLLVDGVRDYAIFSLDLEGRVTSWNSGAEDIYGYRAEEVAGRPFGTFYTSEEAARGAPKEVLRLAAARGHLEEEGWRVRKDGGRFYASAVTTALRDATGAPRGFSKITRDITESKRLQDQLVHQALHDALTGLPNRTRFLDHVDMALRRARRSGACSAVLFLDLDRFKLVNDSLGHAAGDELLRAVAGRLADAVREVDTVARLGGDEFAILCEEIDLSLAVTVAERVIAALAEPLEIAGQELFAAASIGIAFTSGGEKDPGTLLREADAAMYEAKHGGHVRYALFDERLRSRAAERLGAEASLRRAIERDELRVLYQHLVDVTSGEVVGAEALVRWDRRGVGLVSPAEFIPLAEETGLIVPLGAFVLNEACRQSVRWNAFRGEGAKFTVAVNVSAAQLSNDFVGELETALATSGADPATISLELTESTLMGDTEAMSARLATLSGLGVELAIDDFGTGYSSLAYLRRFPVDVLKIDRAFVQELDRHGGDQALVSAITSMAHALKLTVVAEGVETPKQLDAVRALDCDVAQGYHFARPGPAEALDDLMRMADLSGPLDRRS